MKEFIDCVLTNNGLAYFTGVAIFLITLFLTANRVIGFTLTLVFLLFALAAALGIANQRGIQGYFEQLSKAPPSENIYQAPGAKAEGSKINDGIQKAFDDLKAEFLIYKQKLDNLLSEYSSKKEEKQ